AAKQADSFCARFPDDAVAQISVGVVRTRQGRIDDAITAFTRATELAPDNLLAKANLGFSMGLKGRHADAISLLKVVVAKQPRHWSALEKLIFARRTMFDWQGLEDQQITLVNAIADGATDIDPWAIFAFTDDPVILRKVTQNRFAVGSLPAPRHAASPTPRQRIRIAYVSGDFRDHPVAHAIADLIETHDREQFEIIGASYGPENQAPIRQRLANAFDRFVDIRSDSLEAGAKALAELDIDIAIDLSGPTELGQPGLFAHRTAPVQVNYLGYPGSHGAPWIDYVIGDPVTIPEGSEKDFSEHVVRLPHTYFPASRRAIAEATPSRSTAGLPETGVVLSAFHSTWKISPSLFAIWAQLLKDLPGAVLWLRCDNEFAVRNLRIETERLGVDPARIIFAERVDDPAQHLARLRRADLFLDTWSYNAHSTAIETLWAGVPLVTIEGRSFASRVASSVLSAAGLGELVTPDHETYAALVKDIASSPDRLSDLKARLGQARETSPLFDVTGYTRAFETALRVMHERKRKNQKAGPITVAPQDSAS
ncbi:MAG: glycosyltransferase, partial [Hyphomicrobiaceae bacterium]